MAERPVKRCPHCGEDKPLSAFYRDYTRHKTNSWCKDCQRTAGQQTYAKNPHAKARKLAYNRALHRLREAHHAEFTALYNIELEKEGLVPADA